MNNPVFFFLAFSVLDCARSGNGAFDYIFFPAKHQCPARKKAAEVGFRNPTELISKKFQ